MKCKNCGKEFGSDVRVEMVTICETYRNTPIVGIQQKLGADCLWEMDYEDEVVNDGEITDHWYACSNCEDIIPEDTVEAIVKSYTED